MGELSSQYGSLSWLVARRYRVMVEAEAEVRKAEQALADAKQSLADARTRYEAISAKT